VQLINHEGGNVREFRKASLHLYLAAALRTDWVGERRTLGRLIRRELQ